MGKDLDKAIMLRVSKKELNEKTQLPVILKYFKLKKEDCIILSEKISGYNADVQEKRTEMNKLIELVETRQIKEIYVYSLERLYRNIDWLLEFYFKCRKNNVKIYSYLQPEINNIRGDTPVYQFLQLISVLISGFMGMQESFLISERTKKAFSVNEDGERISYKGNKAGKRLDLGDYNMELIRESIMDRIPYSYIMKEVKKAGGKISKGKLSQIKKELFQED